MYYQVGEYRSVDGKDNKAKEDGSKRSPYILYTKVNNLSTDVKDL